MKKETKRYTLVEYLGTRERYYDTLEEYENMLSEVEKSNRRKTSKLYCGNITTQKLPGGRIKATIHVYIKLTDAMTISELDEFTLSKTREELLESVKDKLKTPQGYTPDINIAYFENKNKGEKESIHYDRRIKYIPVMYKGDERYLDMEYISSCFKYHARENDYAFFTGLANEFCFYRVVDEEIEALYRSVNKCRYEGYSSYDMYLAAMRLFRNLILERDRDLKPVRGNNGEYQTSRRRLRDFATYIRDYKLPERKRISPVKYNGKQITKKVEQPVDEPKAIEPEKPKEMQLTLFNYKEFNQ